MKDLFSGHADIYAAFRPTYPEELYQFIFGYVTQKQDAWDCGTGNGQVAQRLALDFENVYATDLSDKQIAQATQRANIYYSVSPAEQTPFENNSFDLITVGQALHWFNIDKFYSEVRRVSRPHAIVALWGYGNIMINNRLDGPIHNFYSDVVGQYWDSARHHVENGYRDISFPFGNIQTPAFYIDQRWTLKHLCGYLESWSATQRYILDKKENPVNTVEPILRKFWGSEETLPIRFPVFLKLGRVN